MAATRPAVLVFQEYANLSVTPATPDLNCLVVGPCYWIQDFPEDRSSIKLSETYGTEGAAASGTATDGVGLGFSIDDAPNNKIGAVLDAASVRVFFVDARVEVAADDDGEVQSGSPDLISSVDFVAAGVVAGDIAVLTYGASTITRTVRSVATNTLTFTSDLDADGSSVKFRIERKAADTEIDDAKVSVTPGTNEINIADGVEIGGKKVSFANVCVAYRSLRQDLQDVKTLSSANEVLGQVGRIDARNPLAAGLFVALQNTATTIQYYGVAQDSLVGYTAFKNAVSSRNDIYAVVPLSSDIAVIAALKAEFENQADPEYAVNNGVAQKFRVVIGSAGELPSYKIVVDASTGAVDVAALKILVDAEAAFVDAGVQPGDVVEIGGTQYAVAAVLSNSRLQTVTNMSAGSPNYRVLRALDRDGQVTELVAVSQSIKSRRAVLCWPDRVDVAGLVDGSLPRSSGAPATPVAAATQPGYYLACAVGAMTSAMPSHQGFTNLSVAGLSKLYNSNTHFSDRQITQLSNGGWFLFQQDTPNALPYIVHQLTTDPSALQFGEFSMVKNFDYVSLFFSDILSSFLGSWNINKETMGVIKTSLQAGIDSLKLQRRVRIGAPILDAYITSVAPSAAAEDRLELYVEVDFPKPLNTIGLHIVSI